MKILLLNLFLLTSMNAFAQQVLLAANDCPDDKKQSGDISKVMKVVQDSNTCPKKEKLISMCTMIANRVKDPSPVDYNQYLYYRRMLEASCVDISKDSEDQKQQKVIKMWEQLEPEMVCSSAIFDVPNGSYLKFAVATRFDEFLDDVIYWKVNLNRIDPVDNRTVLDYVKFHLNQNQGTAMERKLKHYYDILRAAGAKHKSEL